MKIMKRKKITVISFTLIIALIVNVFQLLVVAGDNWNSGLKINFTPASYDKRYDVPEWVCGDQSDLGLEAYEDLSENNIKWNIFVGPLRVYQNYLKVNNMQALTSNGASITNFKDSSSLDPGTPKSEAEILVRLGVLTGVDEDDGTYMYMQNYVKRGEVAKILAVFYENLLPESQVIREAHDFEDTYEHWSKPYIDYCYERGILDGKSESNFDPEGYVTKAESIRLLCNMMNGQNALVVQNIAKSINETYKCTTVYDEDNNSNNNNNNSQNNLLITPDKWYYTVLPNNTVNVEVKCNNMYRKLEFNSVNSNISITRTSSNSGKYVISVKGIYEGVGFIACNYSTGTSELNTVYIPIFVKGYNAYRASNITIRDSNLSLNVGQQYLLSSDVSITPSSASYNGIYFSSTDPNVAYVNYLTGQIIARGNGTCYINVMTYAMSKRVAVKVSGYNYDYGNGGYVNLNLQVGKTLDLKNYIYGAGYNSTYHSNNTSVATVTSNGIVTGRRSGVTQIIVSSGYNQTVVNLSVGNSSYDYNYEVRNISLINNSISILKNEEYDMYDNIYIYPENADISSLKFYSEDTTVAKVGKRDGIVTGIKKGVTRIRIVCNSITRYCTVYVGNESYEDITVSDIYIDLPNNKLTLTKNQTYYLENNITIYPTNASNKKIYYSVDNTSVVTIDSYGKISAISKGDAIVTIKCGDITRYVYIIVDDSQISPTPSPAPTNSPTDKSIRFLSRDAVHLSVGLDFNPYSILNISSGVTFTLSDYSKAKIQNGRVIGVEAGRVTLTATYNGNSDSIDIIVNN